jgi:hypothetical protein
VALLEAGRLSARGAWMNSVPSSAPESWGWDADGIEHGSPVLGALLSVTPALSVGASWSTGPFLETPLGGTLPAGADRWDFRQRIVGLEATYSRGPAVVRSEVFFDRWDIPNVDLPAEDVAWYVEGQSDLVAGLWLAARLGGVHYATLAGSGASAPWDYDLRRIQLAAGYRIVRNAEIKAEWMANSMSGPLDPSDDLLSFQLWWAY